MEGGSFYPLPYYVSVLAQKVALRYIVANWIPDPSQVWLSWFTTMDEDPFTPALRALEPLVRLGIPRIVKLEKKLEGYKQLLERFRDRHEGSLRALRGQREWTSELIEVVQKVSQDRALLGFLHSVWEHLDEFFDQVAGGIFDYTGTIVDESLYNRFDRLVDQLYKESRELPGGILDSTATALKELKSINYWPYIEKAEKINAAMGSREEVMINDHLQWLSDLERNPKLLDEWEDHTPHEIYHDMGESLDESPLYKELEHRQVALKAFGGDAGNLLDVLEETKRLGR